MVDISEFASIINFNMSDLDPGWKKIKRYSDFEEAMRPDSLVEMLRGMMDIINEQAETAFVMINKIIYEDVEADRALLSPEFEGALIGVEGESDEAIIVLKDVVVMQAEAVPDPVVLKFTTLEQRPSMRIPILEVADMSVGNSRMGNDYSV
jgi:hypothetical protein